VSTTHPTSTPHPVRPELRFIGGGARSGKSNAAVQQALAFDTPRVFIATAQALDDEMRTRIALHQQEREEGFDTLEAPHDLAEALRQSQHAKVVIIDCLTLWLSNLLFAGHSDTDIDKATNAWLQEAENHPGTVIVVANEVGLGIVPGDALSRRFRDLAGRLNQRVAARADHVEVRFFGLSMTLKTPDTGTGA